MSGVVVVSLAGSAACLVRRRCRGVRVAACNPARPIQRSLASRPQPCQQRRPEKRKKSKAVAPHRRVCGPEWIQTLCGQLLGREVAIICCGEAHEDAIDLTRSDGIVEPEEDWVEVLTVQGTALGFDPDELVAHRRGLTLEGAKSWAERVLEQLDDKDLWGDETGGAILVFEVQGGSARIFPPHLQSSLQHQLPHGTVVFEWLDLDTQAREYNRRRLQGEEVPAEEYDALIMERKHTLASEGIELFDEWLLRHMIADSDPKAIHVHLVLEAPVPADEVELHVEPGVEPAPPADDCLRCIELDSDEENDGDPDDGTGVFLDYLHRRITEHVATSRFSCIDPRALGDADDRETALSFQALLQEPLPQDTEDVELCAQSAPAAARLVDELEDAEKEFLHRPLPSWEAYFGVASELLYYSGHVKADYTPFLAWCVCSSRAMRSFFEQLYFGTVPEALAELNISEEVRPMTRLRSLMFKQNAPVRTQTEPKPDQQPYSFRRPHDEGLVPVRAAPLDRYLKARGTRPPRTWVSGLAERVRHAGAGEVVAAAQAWYLDAVDCWLKDPKGEDLEGDYFLAWLRECHPEIYEDIYGIDPKVLRDLAWISGEQDLRHDLRQIRIPDAEAAFAEFATFKVERRPSSRMERVLAQILIDIFQVRLVDLAAILSCVEAVVSALEGARVVVVVYAGGDHSRSVVDFWREQGFGSKALIGTAQGWDDGCTRALQLPEYLHDLNQLFAKPGPPRRAFGGRGGKQHRSQ